MTHRKSVSEMLGEFLREASVLVVVFAVLERLLSAQEVHAPLALISCLTSLALLTLGIIVERKRSGDEEISVGDNEDRALD